MPVTESEQPEVTPATEKLEATPVAEQLEATLVAKQWEATSVVDLTSGSTPAMNYSQSSCLDYYLGFGLKYCLSH